MPDQDASDSELRRRGLEHASANAGVETTCTCEGPYRNLRHDQPCCHRKPYLPCKHEIKDLADMGAGTANMCNLDRNGQSYVVSYFSRCRTWQELDGQEQWNWRTQGLTQLVHPAENAEVKDYLQNRPPVIFADLPEDGMHPSVGHNLYNQMIATDASTIDGASDGTSADVHQDFPGEFYTWNLYSTAIYPLMIERAPGVTFEDIDQHRVCGVATASFNADCTKLTPSQDVVVINGHSYRNRRI